MSTYIAGPMSNIPCFNFPLFDEVAAYLRDCGHVVFNPHENDQECYPDIDYAVATVTGDVAALTAEIGFDLHASMQWDLARVLEADQLVLLPNWDCSTGATAERFVAEMTGKEIFLADPDRPGGGIVIHKDPMQRRLTYHPKAQPESEVRVTDPATGGAKGQKLCRMDLLPWDALSKVAEHYGIGAAKYEDRNWERGYAYNLSFAALQRHLAAFWQGEDTDPETDSPHLAAAAFHVLALLAFQIRHTGTDNRPTQEQASPVEAVARKYFQHNLSNR